MTELGSSKQCFVAMPIRGSSSLALACALPRSHQPLCHFNMALPMKKSVMKSMKSMSMKKTAMKARVMKKKAVSKIARGKLAKVVVFKGNKETNFLRIKN